jgi:predicted Fe-Mo cluster-binding NifX family protein
MRICIPVEDDQGLNSVVHGHFGSAPGFVVYDTDTTEVESVINQDVKHEHGSCNPLMSFANVKLDFVVAGGIGGGALAKLNQAGIRVFQATAKTIKENLHVLSTKGLSEFTMQHSCQGHEDGDGCCTH